MAFKKGEINNPKGRSKGAVGKKTEIWNEIGAWFATDGIESYKANLMELMDSDDPDTKLKAMDKFNALIEFFKPKLARTELVGDEKKPLSIVTEFQIPNNERD
jgi:hypothetical protein